MRRVAAWSRVFVVSQVVVLRPEVIALWVGTPAVAAAPRVAASVRSWRSLWSTRTVSVAFARAVSAATTRIIRRAPVTRVEAVAWPVALAARPQRLALLVAAIGPFAWAISIAIARGEPIAGTVAAGSVWSPPRTGRRVARTWAVAASVGPVAVARSVRGVLAVVASRPVPVPRVVLIGAGPSAIASVGVVTSIPARRAKSSIGLVTSAAALARTRPVARPVAIARTGAWPMPGIKSIARLAVAATRSVSVLSWPVIRSRPLLLRRPVPAAWSVTGLGRMAVARSGSVSVGLPARLAARRLTTAPAPVRPPRRRDRPTDEWISRTAREAAFHRALPGQPATIIGPDLRAPAWSVGTELGQRLWPRPDSMDLWLRLRPLVMLVPWPLLRSGP